MGAHLGNGLVVGGGGEGAAVGLSGAVYGLGCCLSYVFLALLLNNFVYQNGYLSLADFLRKRYDNELPAQVYNIVTVLSYLGILGSQLMAGKALFEAMGMNGVVGVFIIAIVVFLYSQISGLWGAFATSVIQSAVIAVGILAAVIYLFQDNAWGLIQEAVAAGTVPETYTSLYKGYDLTTHLMLVIPVSLMIFTDQCSYQRICSAKSDGPPSWPTCWRLSLWSPSASLPSSSACTATSIRRHRQLRLLHRGAERPAPHLRGPGGHRGHRGRHVHHRRGVHRLLPGPAQRPVPQPHQQERDGEPAVQDDPGPEHHHHRHRHRHRSDRHLPGGPAVQHLPVPDRRLSGALPGRPDLEGRHHRRRGDQLRLWAVLFCLLQMAGIYTLPYSAVTLFIPSLVAYVVVSLCTGKKGTSVQ